MCAGPDPANMLFALEHNITDCTNAGGTVETVEGGVKVCKFHYSYLSGNCRQYSMCAGCNYLCNGDECSCPAGWKSYKNWSTTSHVQSYCHVDGGGYTNLVPHAWSDAGRENCWDGECNNWDTVVDYKGCY